MEFTRKILEKLVSGAQEVKKLMNCRGDKVIINDKDQYQAMKKDLIETY